MNVGIFWFHNGTIIGKATPLTEAEEGLPGVFDSSENHVDVWDAIRHQLPAAFRDGEYFELPRGRVLYSKTLKHSIVYMDKTLRTAAIKSAICEFFDLDAQKVKWLVDDHYTTNTSALDRLFGEFD